MYVSLYWICTNSGLCLWAAPVSSGLMVEGQTIGCEQIAQWYSVLVEMWGTSPGLIVCYKHVHTFAGTVSHCLNTYTCTLNWEKYPILFWNPLEKTFHANHSITLLESMFCFQLPCKSCSGYCNGFSIASHPGLLFQLSQWFFICLASHVPSATMATRAWPAR